MQLDVLQLVDLDTDVLKGAQTTNAFDELFFFKLVRRTSHDAYLHPTAVRANEVLNDGGILVALILKPE